MPLPVTDQQLQDALTDELGQVGNTAFATQLTTWWAIHADKAYAPGLQYLYVKLAGCQYLAAKAGVKVTWSAGDRSQSSGQEFDHWIKLADDVRTEIERVEKRFQALRTPASGLLTTTTLRDHADASTPDPNDPAYRGDPEFRSGLRLF